MNNESDILKDKVKTMRCEFWDCGWCYAPISVETNAGGASECNDPMSCPHILKR